MHILGLGYVGLTVPDVARWQKFGEEVLGLSAGLAPGRNPWLPEEESGEESGEKSGYGPDGTFFFRIDEWAWRLALHPGEAPGLRYVGFEVRGEAELGDARAALEAAGLPARRGSADDCAARAVSGLLVTEDPGGNRVELFFGPRVSSSYRNRHGMTFLTGALGMGHINLFASNYEKSRAFYVDLLGFRLTDYYRVGPEQTINFFHVNPRHHTIGLMQVAPMDALHHIMFEATDIDMVGMAYDRVLAAGCRVTASLGRHSNDHILSFYVESPSGVDIEIGWGARTVGPDWTPTFRGPGDLWGHHGLTASNIEQTGKRA